MTDKCSAVVEAGVAVLHLRGSLNAGFVKEFREIAWSQLDSGHRWVVMNFSEVDDIDGQVLASLMSFYRRLRGEQKGRLALAGLNPEIRQFLDRTCLSKVIPISHHWKDALAEVRS